MHKLETKLEVTAFQVPAKGWQIGMQSNIQLFLTNPLDDYANFVVADYCFLLDGHETDFKGSFAGNVCIAPKTQTAQEYCPVFLPAELCQADQQISLALTCYAETNATKLSGYCCLDINVSEIKEPFKCIQGQYIALEYSESSFNGIKRCAEIISFLDSAYLKMAELTGQKPMQAKTMALRESAALGYYARAGFPILLNAKFAKKDLIEFDKGAVVYPWLHEIGHNFDYGYWYMYNSGACEFHANFKLVYAIEQLFKTERQDFQLYAWGKDSSSEMIFKTGLAWVEDCFFDAEKEYFEDPSRDWKSLSSNELLVFYLSLVRKYGWQPFKKMYRAYRSMNARGIAKPVENSAIEMMSLQMAILFLAIGDPLLAHCHAWRLPITKQKIEEMITKYQVLVTD